MMVKFIRFLAYCIFFSGLVLGFRALPITYITDVTWTDLNKLPTNAYSLRDFIFYIADNNDTIVTLIDSPGGYVVTATRYINNTLTTDAHTISRNIGISASAAGIIAMASKEKWAAPYSAYLFHRPYFMRYLNGFGNPPTKILAGTNTLSYKLIQSFMETHVFKYLTAEEIIIYNEGGDVILMGTEMMKRIKAYE